MAAALVGLLAELARFADDLRDVGEGCDNELWVEVAGDLDALALRYAIAVLETERRAA